MKVTMNTPKFLAMVVLGTVGTLGPATPAIAKFPFINAAVITTAALVLLINAIVARDPIRSPLFWLSPICGAGMSIFADTALWIDWAIIWSMTPIAAYLVRIGLGELREQKKLSAIPPNKPAMHPTSPGIVRRSPGVSGKHTGSQTDGDVATSMLVGVATNNAFMGYAAGRSMKGGILGESIGSSISNDHSHTTVCSGNDGGGNCSGGGAGGGD